MSEPFEVTLKPLEDDAASITLYVYAAMTGDEELRTRLDAVDWGEARPGGFESLCVDPKEPFRFLETLSMPDLTHAGLVENFREWGLEPVAFVVRFAEPEEPKVLVKLEVGGSVNGGRPGVVIALHDGRSGRESEA